MSIRAIARRAFATIPVALTILVGCEKSSPEPAISPSRIISISGGNQTGTVGNELAQPLVVEVQFADGTPGPGQTVFWFAQTGGDVLPGLAVTDSLGRARTVAQLGNVAGAQSFLATFGEMQVSFTATAVAGPAAAILGVSGSGQSDVAGRTLAQPLVVRVTDVLNNPKSGVTVLWSRTAGTGTLSAASSVTGSTGQASVSYTLGASAGTETIKATVTGIASTATFTVTATASLSSALSSIGVSELFRQAAASR